MIKMDKDRIVIFGQLRLKIKYLHEKDWMVTCKCLLMVTEYKFNCDLFYLTSKIYNEKDTTWQSILWVAFLLIFLAAVKLSCQ